MKINIRKLTILGVLCIWGASINAMEPDESFETEQKIPVSRDWVTQLFTKLSEQREERGEEPLPEEFIYGVAESVYHVPRDIELWLQVLLKKKLKVVPENVNSKGTYLIDDDGDVWDINSWQKVFDLKKELPEYYITRAGRHKRVALSNGGTFVIYGTQDEKGAVSIMHKDFGKNFIRNKINIVFNADDSQVALLQKNEDSGVYTFTVHNINIAEGSLSAPIRDVLADVRTLRPGANFDPENSFLVISPKNNYAVLNNPLLVYEISDGNWTPIDTRIYGDAALFIPEETGERILLFVGDDVFTVVDTNTWQVVTSIHADDVVGASLSRRSAYVILETGDKKLHIFSGDTGEEVFSIADVNTWKLTQSMVQPEVIVGIKDNNVLFVYDVAAQQMLMEQKIKELEYPWGDIELVPFDEYIICAVNSTSFDNMHEEDVSYGDLIPMLFMVSLEKNTMANLPLSITRLPEKNGYVSVKRFAPHSFLLQVGGIRGGLEYDTYYEVPIKPGSLRRLWGVLSQEQRNLIYAIFDYQQRFGGNAILSLTGVQTKVYYSLPKKLQKVLAPTITVDMAEALSRL